MFVKNGSVVGGDLDVLIGFLSSPNNLVDSDISIENYESESESGIETNLISLIKKIIAGFFKNSVEFFGNVIFRGNVTFLGRPQFDKDTAGHALIKAGESEVRINFEREYERVPSVNVNINLTEEVNFDKISKFAVYDLSTKGFKIKLSEATAFDLIFSWIALGVNGESFPEPSIDISGTTSSTESVVLSPTISVNPTPEEASPSGVLTQEEDSLQEYEVLPSQNP
jgi:hypothetical protein